MEAQTLQDYRFLFTDQEASYIRIPVWGHIALPGPVRKIIEHPRFLRLEKVRQLSFAYLVFPGAVHSRFDHSIGVYHITREMLKALILNKLNLDDAGQPMISPQEARIFLASALLHDIGHYPFAHTVEGLCAGPNGDGPCFEPHERRAQRLLLDERGPGSLYGILKSDWGIDQPEEVAQTIGHSGAGKSLTANLLSGIIDPDKMDYLMRDATFCNVPYGHIDVSRLLESLVIDRERMRLGILEKGIAPVESLIFSKYMMYRYIYWHHTVRIASMMLRRFLEDGMEAGVVQPEAFYEKGEDELLCALSQEAVKGAFAAGHLIDDLNARRLYKRALVLHTEYSPHIQPKELRLSERDVDHIRVLYDAPALRRAKEREICRHLSRTEGCTLDGSEVLLDIPKMTTAFDLDDFSDLYVYVELPIERGKHKFVQFITSRMSQVDREFLKGCDRCGRRIRVICRADLREAVVRRWREAVGVIKG